MDERSVDDDVLVEVLRDAVHAVPAQVLRDAKAIYTWRTVDAELAALVYDSANDRAVAMRSDPAVLRSMEFTAGAHGVALDINDHELHAQLLPARPGLLDIETADGEHRTYEADDTGYVVIVPVPCGSIRLRCSSAGAALISTDWIQLRREPRT